MDKFLEWAPFLGTIVGSVLFLVFTRRLLDWTEARLSGKSFRNQVIMILLTAVFVVIAILVLPMDQTMRGQVLSLVGIVASAAMALSSTTLLGNAMAGVMLRAVRSFRMGDFIRTEAHFGRVSEIGLVHTEIQTEDRELTTIPNLFLVTHPVTTTRASGTIVSAVVSLGYDVPRRRVEELLLEAAAKSELSDPFVQVVELGDFSVSYRVAGMLTEVKRLISARSGLRKSVMDSLHEGGVEIVSPTFMNTRAFDPATAFIPKPAERVAERKPQAAPETLVFDKAEAAASIENLRSYLASVEGQIEALKSRAKRAPDGPEREQADRELAELESRKERLGAVILAREPQVAKGD